MARRAVMTSGLDSRTLSVTVTRESSVGTCTQTVTMEVARYVAVAEYEHLVQTSALDGASQQLHGLRHSSPTTSHHSIQCNFYTTLFQYLLAQNTTRLFFTLYQC